MDYSVFTDIKSKSTINYVSSSPFSSLILLATSSGNLLLFNEKKEYALILKIENSAFLFQKLLALLYL